LALRERAACHLPDTQSALAFLSFRLPFSFLRNPRRFPISDEQLEAFILRRPAGFPHSPSTVVPKIEFGIPGFRPSPPLREFVADEAGEGRHLRACVSIHTDRFDAGISPRDSAARALNPPENPFFPGANS